jgi:putative ABC transport system permease protein
MGTAALRTAFHALSGAALRDHPGRFALAVLGIALGVALGVAVHLVNTSALNEFSLAVHHLSGEADLVVRGPRGGFDESVYAQLARLPQVQAASPALEMETQLAGRRETLKILGVDPFRSAQVQPELLAGAQDRIVELFDADALLLSPAAADWLGLKTGDALRVHVGTSGIELKIIGLLAPGAYRQRLALMDIASAQWRLQRLGRLDRIDLRLRPGVDIETFRRELTALLPANIQVATPHAEAERNASLSRAYRLNLDMLALVALFTGGFLVFSTQVLAVLRRRTQLALLRVLGLTRAALVGLLVGEGVLIGILGSTLGVALGCGLADYALARFGADLGAGYFRTVSPVLHVAPAALTGYWMLGVGFAMLGAAAPAIDAGQRAPALALRAGDEEESLKKRRSTWTGVTLSASGLALALAPPVGGLPVLGYAAIALILLGGILVLPRLVAILFDRLPLPRFPPAMLAIAQLQATPRQVALSVAAIVTSFSLMVSMLIMVVSFRQSLDAWLIHMLPADLYVRAARAGETGFFTPDEQARIAATPGVARARFLRSQSLQLEPDRPPLVLLARTVEANAAHPALPLIGSSIVPGPNAPPPVWVSEIAADLLSFRVGDRVRLPIGEQAMLFTIAGVWRDYARQSGAIVIDRDLYIQITGDRLANDAALWLAPDVAPGQVEQALREQLGMGDGIEIAEMLEIRAASLSIFDRTFAVTYALEIVAVLIGLFGVSVSFSAQALARRREFGVLRHLGMSRREIGLMLGCEGTLVAGLGAGCGVALGWLIGVVLIHVINRQSFHWSMDMHTPWLPLAALAMVLIAAASATAVWSGRRAMTDDVIQAVREDW